MSVPTGTVVNIFDIERYATDDGPGIRTVVFLKGCNLRCSWCQNPESQRFEPQVMYDRSRCVACRRCVTACPVGAVREVAPFGFISNPDICTTCGACVDACFTGARKIVGTSMTVDQVLAEILKDAAYYRDSGGGVTFSGGEPLLQPDAVIEMARRCRAEGIHTALETAGHVPWPTLERVLPWIDLLYFDFKHVDDTVHREYTGVPVSRILKNIRAAATAHPNMMVRIPVIPGVNDSAETIRRMFAWLVEHTRVRSVQLLPFHRLGLAKYEGLGLAYAMDGVENLGREDLRPYQAIGHELGLRVRVGA